MLRTRPLNTSTFKVTIVYLGLFSLSAVTLLAFVYMASVRFMERQTRETIEDEIAWLIEQYGAVNLPVLQAIIDERAAAEPNRRAVYVLTDPDGDIIAGNLSGLPVNPRDEDSFIRFELQVLEDGRRQNELHQAVAKAVMLHDGELLLVGRDIEDKIRTQTQMRIAILLGAGVMVVLGLGGGLVMSRWMLHRLERINRTTAQIMAGNLSQRIRTNGGGDEFDELAQNLNAMLERIERLLIGMRQVTDDIAHDLRTPLTRLRSRIEVALMGELKPDEIQDLLGATMQDVDAMIDTFNALLNIARAEAGAPQTEWERIDLSELARDVLELYEPLAEDTGIAVRLDAPAPVPIHGNRQLVAQAIANIADNAVKYTPAGGTVTITTRNSPAPAIMIADSGPGIPADQREQAKKRFVRLDAQRSTPGSGLGLSLVDAVAKLHEAKLELEDNMPGLRVTLAFRPLPQTGPVDTRHSPSAVADPLVPTVVRPS